MNTTNNSLPVTRKKQFFDILRNRWRLLIQVGLIVAVFFIPFLITSFFKDYFLSNIVLDSQYFVDGEFTESGYAIYRSLIIVTSIFNIILIFLFTVGLSGVKKILKKIAWSDGVLFWHDFVSGVKENYLSDIFYSLIFGAIYFTIQLSSNVLNNVVITIIILAASLFIFIPLIIISYFYNGVYITNFVSRIKNTSILYVKNLPILLVLSVVFSLFFLLGLMPFQLILIKQIIVLLVVFLFTPLYLLLSQMLCSNIFDKDINKNLHPEIYRKGLY